MIDNLLMAVLSSLVPGFGLFGSLVQFITSENPKAGKRFILDVATAGLGGGFATNFLVDVAKEVYFGSQVEEATTLIAPHNQIALRCHTCGRFTNYYVRSASRITCSTCLSHSISCRVNRNDKIYIIRTSIYRIHNEIYQSNLRLNKEINNPSIDSDPIDNKFI